MTVTRFSKEKVLDLVGIIKITTAVGPDGPSSAFLRHGAVTVTDALTSLINSIFSLHSTPTAGDPLSLSHPKIWRFSCISKMHLPYCLYIVWY